MKNDRLVSTGDAPISAPHTTIPDFFRAFLETDKDIQWCLYGLSIQEENRLLEALKDGTAMAISDGSYKDTFGTAAWTIGNQETASIIAGKAVCPGAACDHDAYRGELAGIYSIMVIMERFCDNHNIKDCAIEIGCDGKSSLETALEKGTKLFRDIPSFDLVAAIMQLHRNSPLTWTSRFVKGHQDDEGHDLHSWATRNVLMDLWAKQQLAVAKSSPRHFSDKGEPWQLWVAGRKLTSNISNQIYLAVHRADGISYWQSKPEVSAEVTNTVDWVAIGHTMKGVVRGRTVFVSKHMSGMCGVGKFMQRWQQWETDQCPRCGEKEDSAHVWTCQDLIAREIRSKSLASIELLLRQWNTDPTIVHVLLLYLKSWQTGEGVQYQPPRELEAVIQEQTYISWNRFFEGWFSTRWAEILQRFYTITKSNCTGKRWVSALIKKFWDTAWDLLEHRNGVLHEKENLVTRSIGLHLNQRVTRVYLNLCSRSLWSTDRHLSQFPLSKLLVRNVNYKIQWLEVAEPALREERRLAWQNSNREPRMVTGMQHCMLSWLSCRGSG